MRMRVAAVMRLLGRRKRPRVTWGLKGRPSRRTPRGWEADSIWAKRWIRGLTSPVTWAARTRAGRGAGRGLAVGGGGGGGGGGGPGGGEEEEVVEGEGQGGEGEAAEGVGEVGDAV